MIRNIIAIGHDTLLVLYKKKETLKYELRLYTVEAAEDVRTKNEKKIKTLTTY